MRPYFARRLVVGILGLLLLVPLAAVAGDSNLDPTFGSFGIVTTAIGSASSVGVATALQSDGRIVVAGIALNTDSTTDIALTRYLQDGSLDPSFGTGGVVVTDVGYTDQAVAVAIQPDGKIVIAGDTNDFSLIQFLVARYLPNGSPDGAFGLGGVVTTPIGGVRAQATGVVVQPDGRIVAAGSAVIAGDYQLALARYDDAGVLDPTFGAGGIVLSNVGGEATANALVRQPDGKLVVAGTRFTNNAFTSSDVVLVRYTDTGSLDGTFGTGGVAARDLGPGIDTAEAVVLRPDGTLVTAGTYYVGDYSTNAAVLLVGFKPSGSADGAFGLGGLVIGDFTPGHEAAVGLTRLPDGRLVAVGETGPVPIVTGTLDWLVLRVNANGSPDLTFGTGGHLTLPIGSGNDFPHDVVAQSDGKIVVVGSGQMTMNVGSTFALARLGGDCGNGVQEPGEECDDGNATDGDCCSRGCQAEAAGNACTTNDNLCKSSQCDGTGHCGRGIPAVGCKLPTVPLKSQLQFKNKTPNKGDLAVWKWLKGAATTLADYGDPVTTTNYALCMYEDSSTGALLFQTDAPAGGTCGTKPCWKALNGKGFSYRDKDATPNGDISTLLKIGDAGKARALVKAKGGNLTLPLLPLPLPVRTQLRASNGQCWEADFSNAGVQANDATQFKGKSD